MSPAASAQGFSGRPDRRLEDGRVLPRGALINYREYYGMKPGHPNIGLKQSAEEVGLGIISRDNGDPITYSVSDPAMHISDGGPSIAERIAKATDGRVILQRADNRRVGSRGQLGGWDVVRSRLKGQGEDAKPMLYVFSTCENLIRTLPALQHDQNRPEDVDTEGEDHAPDAARYACMSRPWISDPDPETKWNDWLAELLRPKTLNEMLEQYDDERAEEES